MNNTTKFHSANEIILAQSEDFKKFTIKDFKVVSKINLINSN